MIVRIAAPAALLAALALSPAVAAKGVENVEICGPDRCTGVSGDARHQIGLDLGSPESPPAHRAPFYRLTLDIFAGARTVDRMRLLWVPSTGQFRLRDEGGTAIWTPAPPPAVAVLRAATRGLRPFPAAGLPLPRPAPRVPAARVSDVVEVPGAGSDEGGIDWWVALLAVAGAGAAGLTARRLLRRR